MANINAGNVDSSHVQPTFWQLLTRPAPADDCTSNGELRTFLTPPDFQFKPFPGKNSSIIERLLYSWSTPLLVTGYYKPLEPTDITDLPEQIKADKYVNELENAMNEFQGYKLQFFTALCYVNRWRYLYKAAALRMFTLTLMLMRPLLLRQILLSVEKIADAKSFDWSDFAVCAGWCTAMTVTAVTFSIAQNLFFWIGLQCGLTARGAIMGSCFRKALRVDYIARNNHPVSVNNLVSIDSEAIMTFMWNRIIDLWAQPLQIVLSALGLIIVLGHAAWYGIAFMLLALLFTTRLADKMRKQQQAMMRAADERVRKFSEVLLSIKVVKLYAYENVMIDDLKAIRSVQERALRLISIIGAVNRCIGFTTPLLTSLITFVMYIHFGHRLNPVTAFVSLLLFQMLREPLSKVPDAINELTRCYVAQRRIEEFLQLPERIDYVQKHIYNADGTSFPCTDVEMIDGTFTWSQSSNDICSSLSDIHVNSPTVSPASHFSRISKSNNSDEYHSLSKIELSPLENCGRRDSISSFTSEVILKSISFHLPAGKLMMIIGTVGAGRSSLLLSILGEMHCIAGTIRRPLRTSYAAQVPFLISATVRENIVFGLPFDEKRYRQVLYACALEHDCMQWPFGDLSLIGENGLMASGGQRARIALARCCYADADLYLIDSPLAAVDSHVAQWLFDHVLGPNGMLREKTRILVENQLQFCAPSKAHEILVMREGEIVDRGPYEELSQRFDFDAVVAKQKGMLKEASDDEAKYASSPIRNTLDSTLHGESSFTGALGELDLNDVSDDVLATDAEAETVETAAHGNVGVALARIYFQMAASPLGWMFMLALLVGSQAASILSDYWLSRWSSMSTASNLAHSSGHSASTAKSISHIFKSVSYETLGWHSMTAIDGAHQASSASSSDFPSASQVYAILVCTAGALMLARSLTLALSMQRAGNMLHAQFLSRVLTAPQHFYDSHPTAQISNRFGKDQQSVDSELPNRVTDLFSSGALCGGVIVLVIAVAPMSILPICVLAAVYIAIQHMYRPASRELKRLLSISQTGIYSAVGESASGLLTLRAFGHNGAVQRASDVADQRIDANTRIYFASFGANRWVGVRLELIGAAFVFVASISTIMLSRHIGASLVGLSITTSLAVTSNLSWLVRLLSELEVQLNSVERVIEFARIHTEEEHLTEFLSMRDHSDVNPEADDYSGEQEVEDVSLLNGALRKLRSRTRKNAQDHQQNWIVLVEPPADWPRHGEITFRNLSVSYKPSPNGPRVIKNLSVTLEGGHKIGLCGRTGSGKSSMILSIFRLILWQTGTILIDGVDLATVPLVTLRSRISLVPQDPVLFRGTLRYNIDPSLKSSDEILWSVLERVKLRNWAESLPGKLDFDVSDGGDNISLGQRQLIALGRSLVRRSRILIMDEATASLDFETDQAIREVLATVFKGCTVICIAHRLGSILDSDRILVLDAGEIKEFGSPVELLQNQDGLFSQLLRASNASAH